MGMKAHEIECHYNLFSLSNLREIHPIPIGGIYIVTEVVNQPRDRWDSLDRLGSLDNLYQFVVKPDTMTRDLIEVLRGVSNSFIPVSELHFYKFFDLVKELEDCKQTLKTKNRTTSTIERLKTIDNLIYNLKFSIEFTTFMGTSFTLETDFNRMLEEHFEIYLDNSETVKHLLNFTQWMVRRRPTGSTSVMCSDKERFYLHRAIERGCEIVELDEENNFEDLIELTKVIEKTWGKEFFHHHWFTDEMSDFKFKKTLKKAIKGFDHE